MLRGSAGDFYFFALAADFVSAVPALSAAPAAVSVGGTTAAGRPPLMGFMVEAEAAEAEAQARSPAGVLVPTADATTAAIAALCSACVMVNSMYLKAVSGCGPSGYGDYLGVTVSSHASFRFI